MTVAHEIVEGAPQVIEVGKAALRRAHRPFVPVPLAVHMKMWARNLLIVGIPMWPAAEIKPDENDCLSRPILIRSLQQVNSAPEDIEQKGLAPADRLERNAEY